MNNDKHFYTAYLVQGTVLSILHVSFTESKLITYNLVHVWPYLEKLFETDIIIIIWQMIMRHREIE